MKCPKCDYEAKENAKFCPSCGEPLNENAISDDPFEQVSQAQDGTINLGVKRKNPKLWTRILIAIGIILVISALYTFFFDFGPIYAIETATGYDSETYLPTGKTSTFYADTPIIYVTFSTRDIDLQVDVQADWYLVKDAVYISSNVVTITYDEQQNVIYLEMPDGGWKTGKYQIDFYIGEEYNTSVTFTVK